VWVRKSMHVTFSFVFSSKCAKIRTSNFRKVVLRSSNYWRYGGKCYVDFVGNLLLFTAATEFSKSAKNWQSYRREFGVLLFWGHGVYFLIRVCCYTMTVSAVIRWCTKQALCCFFYPSVSQKKLTAMITMA